MQAPADYTTSEVTNGSPVLPIGEQCEAGKYRLVGYKSGSSLEEAEAATLMPSPPQYMDIISDRYVIVVNEKCPGEGAQTHTKVHIYKYLRSGENVEQVQNDAAIPSFPMKVTFTAVIGGTPYVNSGPHEYVLGNGHGGAAYLYAADTSPMDTPVASY